jgi:cardiolipin synthase
VVTDADFSRALRQQIASGIADGEPISADAFNHRSWRTRLWHGTAFFIYRFLMRIITIGNDER